MVAGRYEYPQTGAPVPASSGATKASAPAESAKNEPEISDRAVGAMFLAIGLLCGYVGVVSPLLAAAEHIRSINLYIEAAALVPFSFVYGTISLVLGNRTTPLFGIRRGHRPTPLGWMTIVVLVGAGFLLYAWLKAMLTSMGYRT